MGKSDSPIITDRHSFGGLFYFYKTNNKPIQKPLESGFFGRV